MAPHIFQSVESFEQAFIDRLKKLLQNTNLATFVLACANASRQEVLLSALSPAIESQYRQLQSLFRQGRLDTAKAEDRTLFAYLVELGMEHLPATEQRWLGPWSVQYNILRGFRPLGHGAEAPAVLHLPFDSQGFSFNKPFMLEELFWQGELASHSLAAYYNKFPFADYHLLWVPDRLSAHPQYLRSHYHRLIWQMQQDLCLSLAGFAVGYSAMGACASVNHLHFQSYMGEALSITHGCWQHNGGVEEYPLAVFVFQDPDEAWRLIDQLHQQNQPYNLLYTQTAIYCLPRRRQGSVALPDWSPGFAWREVCGEMLCLHRDGYLSLTRQELENTLRKWRVEI